MVEFPKIPIRFHYSGDKIAATALAGLGKKRFADLVNSMFFQGLNTGFNTLKLANGSTIKTISSYGVSNIYIYVPILLEELEDQEEWFSSILFYYRIKNDGVTYSELKMDRIIIWKMNLGAGPSFAKSIGDINCGGRFTPGEGEIVLDVDVINEIVYPEDPTRDTYEETQLIADANAYIEQINQISDISGEMFNNRKISNPVKAFEICNGLSVEHDEIELYLNEGWLDAELLGYDYWHMIEEYPNTSSLQTAWKNKYCPASGGDPATDYDANIWPGIDDNAECYGLFTYQRNALDFNDPANPDWWNHHYVCCARDIEIGDYQYGVYDLKGLFIFGNTISSLYAEEDVYKNILDGDFYTGKNGINQYPSFFCFFYTGQDSGATTFTENAFDNIGDVATNTNNTIYYEINYTTSYVSVGGINSLVSPLETISLSEMTEVNNNLNGCNDIDCFELANELSIFGNATTDVRAIYFNRLPCELIIAGEDVEFVSKESTCYSSFFSHKINIPNPDAFDKNGQINFASLVSYYESNVKVQAAYMYGVSTTWVCNGVNYGPDFVDVPETYAQAHGVVIYIFAPEYFESELDPVNSPEVMTYWDIHTARYTNKAINPYRCLDLEERVIEAISGIKKDHRDSITLSKYDGSDPDSVYSLEHYKYSQTHGFINKI